MAVHHVSKGLHRPDRALPGPRASLGVKVSKVEYVNTAAKRFLEGLPCKSPEEAVQAGFRTLLDWCGILEEERLMAGVVYSVRDKPTVLVPPLPRYQSLDTVRGLNRPRARPARPPTLKSRG